VSYGGAGTAVGFMGPMNHVNLIGAGTTAAAASITCSIKGLPANLMGALFGRFDFRACGLLPAAMMAMANFFLGQGGEDFLGTESGRTD